MPSLCGQERQHEEEKSGIALCDNKGMHLRSYTNVPMDPFRSTTNLEIIQMSLFFI
jgi:hypothetical protein